MTAYVLRSLTESDRRVVSSPISVGRCGITPTIRREFGRRGALGAILLGFQYEREARAFLRDLRARLRKFELALHPKKTRLIRFGCHAAEQR